MLHRKTSLLNLYACSDFSPDLNSCLQSSFKSLGLMFTCLLLLPVFYCLSLPLYLFSPISTAFLYTVCLTTSPGWMLYDIQGVKWLDILPAGIIHVSKFTAGDGLLSRSESSGWIATWSLLWVSEGESNPPTTTPTPTTFPGLSHLIGEPGTTTTGGNDSTTERVCDPRNQKW